MFKLDLAKNELEMLQAAMNSWTSHSINTYRKYDILAVETLKTHANIHEKILNALKDK